MSTDAELLRHYVEHRDERAFAELVRRYLGLVYSAALRRTGGRTQVAEEIAQKVFSDVARKAAALARHPSLTGWLYRSTRYAVIDALRAEIRRQKLAQSLTTMPDIFPTESPVDWERIRPVLDAAMDRLNERDREIMLLRFFQGQTYAEVGAKMHLTENAARMRTERALDKLRSQLSRRGVTSTAAALGLLLANQSLVAAPVGLSVTVSAAALSAAPAGGLAGTATIFFMSKLAVPLVSAALAAGLTVVVWTSLHHQVSAQELAALRWENVRLTQATAAGASADSVAAVADEFSAHAAAVARAMERRHPVKAAGTAATPPSAGTGVLAANTHGHRDHGQTTARDAMFSFAWAADAGEVGALAKLVWFDGKGRTRALEVLASMPDSLRAQYPTPEELYAFFLAADALVAPPPGADLIERCTTVEAGPGRVSLQRPGQAPDRYHQHQQTPEGWKFVIPEPVVDIIPQVLNNEMLAKLGNP